MGLRSSRIAVNTISDDLRLTANKLERVRDPYKSSGRMRRAADYIERLEEENRNLRARLG